MDLMRDMEFESENQTAIVVSSPSTTSLTLKQSTEAAKTAPQAAAPQTMAPNTPSHTTTSQTKPVAGTHGHTSTTAPNTLHKKISVQQTTPTKKPSHLKNLKTRTLSQSAITSAPGTSKSGSGCLHSSSGITSPSHRFSVTSSSSIGSGTRQRGATYSSGTKSQVLAQQTGSGNLSSPASSNRGSAESIPSSSSKERKITSPSRTSRTKL